MKTFISCLVCSCLLKALVSSPAEALNRHNDRDMLASVWVQSPCATFEMRTCQDTKGDLIVQVNNQSGRDLAVTLQTARSEKVAFVPIPRQQGVFIVKLNIAEVPAGTYQVAVMADTQKAVQLIRLATLATQPLSPGKLVVRLAR